MHAKISRYLQKFPLLRRVSKFIYISAGQLNATKKWRKLSRSNNIYLELGSGPKSGENGWTTVDLYGADINYDLRNGIPLRESSVDAIYTSHMLEHIPFNSLIPFIQECERVLKKGASLSVCVPNAGFYIRAYINQSQFCDVHKSLYRPAIVDTGSYIDQLNYIAYMDGQHHYLFDEQNLVNTLRRGGFTKVELRNFDPLVDIPSRDFESIYAIAIKS